MGHLMSSASRRALSGSCPSQWPKSGKMSDRATGRHGGKRSRQVISGDDGGGRTGFPANRFAAFYIELMMYEIERAIPTPQVEIIVQRRARRQVFRDRPPLTTGGENIHEAVYNLARDHCAFVAAVCL